MKGKAEDIGMKRLCSILLALLLLLGACSGEESKNGESSYRLFWSYYNDEGNREICHCR